MDVLERLKICASGGSIVPNRKLCGDAYDEIARLTVELEVEKAKRAEAVDAETRACAAVILNDCHDDMTRDEEAATILARLDQRKEAGR